MAINKQQLIKPNQTKIINNRGNQGHGPCLGKNFCDILVWDKNVQVCRIISSEINKVLVTQIRD